MTGLRRKLSVADEACGAARQAGQTDPLTHLSHIVCGEPDRADGVAQSRRPSGSYRLVEPCTIRSRP